MAIIQGSNSPIEIVFDVVPVEIKVALVNEIAVLRQWTRAELQTDSDMLVYYAPITQEESQGWEEGPCWIEVRWIDLEGDLEGVVQFARVKDEIVIWKDSRLVDEEETIVTLPLDDEEEES